MGKRPMCLVCLLLMLVLCLLDGLGIPLIRGNPLPQSLQAWIVRHPEAVICGEVQQCAETEFSQSIYLKGVYLLYPEEKEQNFEAYDSAKEKSLTNFKEKNSKEKNSNEKNPNEKDSYKKVSIENVRVFLKKEKGNTIEKIPAGTFLEVSGRLVSVPEARNPGEFDSRQYYGCRHIYYFMKDGVIRQKSDTYSAYFQGLLDVRERFAQIYQKAAGADAAVFEAMVLGEKGNLEQETKMRYQMAGIIHILAISGMHISLLGAGLNRLLKKAGLGIIPAGMVSLVLMLQYGMMTGSSVAAMRAVCMFLMAVSAELLGRCYDGMTALSLSAILLLFNAPANLYSSGFLLSFGAVAGLGIAAPVVSGMLGSRAKIVNILAASLSVQLMTLPVMLYFYGEVSLMGIFLNLAVLPTVGAVLASGVLGGLAGLFCLKAAEIILLPGRSLLFLYEKLCQAAGKLPWCTWIGGQPELWQILGYYAVLFLALLLGKNAIKRRKTLQGDSLTGEEYKVRRKRAEAGRRKNGKRGNGKRKGWEVARGPEVARSPEIAKGSEVARSPEIAKGPEVARGPKIARGPEATKVLEVTRAPELGMLLLLCLGIGILGWHSREALTITCLDVGQGDGIVAETPEGYHFLIDCGSSNKSGVGQYQLLPYLKSQGISYLDGIFVSHTDEDHISGLKELLTYMGDGLTSIRAGTLYLPGWSQPGEAWEELQVLAENAGVQVTGVNAGDAVKAGRTSLTILWPPEGAAGQDVNEEGMVMEVKCGDFQALFTGDIGEETEKKLLSGGCLGDVDFLKVGHHGSRYSSSLPFLEKILPELGVISCSAANTYGHPSPETMERLEGTGCHLEYTMKNGAITLRTDGARMWVERFVK